MTVTLTAARCTSPTSDIRSEHSDTIYSPRVTHVEWKDKGSADGVFHGNYILSFLSRQVRAISTLLGRVVAIGGARFASSRLSEVPRVLEQSLLITLIEPRFDD